MSEVSFALAEGCPACSVIKSSGYLKTLTDGVEKAGYKYKIHTAPSVGGQFTGESAFLNDIIKWYPSVTYKGKLFPSASGTEKKSLTVQNLIEWLKDIDSGPSMTSSLQVKNYKDEKYDTDSVCGIHKFSAYFKHGGGVRYR